MGSTLIKILSGEHASEPPKTALAPILGGGAFFVLRGTFFGVRSPLRKFLRAPMHASRNDRIRTQTNSLRKNKNTFVYVYVYNRLLRQRDNGTHIGGFGGHFPPYTALWKINII